MSSVIEIIESYNPNAPRRGTNPAPGSGFADNGVEGGGSLRVVEIVEARSGARAGARYIVKWRRTVGVVRGEIDLRGFFNVCRPQRAAVMTDRKARARLRCPFTVGRTRSKEVKGNAGFRGRLQFDGGCGLVGRDIGCGAKVVFVKLDGETPPRTIFGLIYQAGGPLGLELHWLARPTSR